MQVSRMIFYDVVDGTIIKDTGEYPNAARQKTIDEQIATYSELQERERTSFDVLELGFGQYSEEFKMASSVRVDVDAKKLEFIYNDSEPNTPYSPPISEELQKLKQENKLLKAQSQANTDKADFQDEVITEIIMTLYQ